MSGSVPRLTGDSVPAAIVMNRIHQRVGGTIPDFVRGGAMLVHLATQFGARASGMWTSSSQLDDSGYLWRGAILQRSKVREADREPGKLGGLEIRQGNEGKGKVWKAEVDSTTEYCTGHNSLYQN
ncbi:unnamed protein product [Phytophthora fragariaefolia]|uniref:Unnamed protein product n=1 Tax=Phytophthora fragariaefolia TaxID=1490495 RepID=A0A9W6YP70_9STRA|nr:unnamed protein product [Phytophthora fragariaefolia]